MLWEIAGRMAGLPAGSSQQRPASQVVARSRQYLESAYTKFIRYTQLIVGFQMQVCPPVATTTHNGLVRFHCTRTLLSS